MSSNRSSKRRRLEPSQDFITSLVQTKIPLFGFLDMKSVGKLPLVSKSFSLAARFEVNNRLYKKFTYFISTIKEEPGSSPLKKALENFRKEYPFNSNFQNLCNFLDTELQAYLTDISAKISMTFLTEPVEILLTEPAFAAYFSDAVKSLLNNLQRKIDLLLYDYVWTQKKDADPKIVTSLVARGADFNAKKMDNGLTTLQNIIICCRETILQIMIDAGADPNFACFTRDHNKREILSLLMLAAINNRITVTQKLLEAKADVDQHFPSVTINIPYTRILIQSRDHRTALCFAAQSDHDQVATLLIENGASLKFTDDFTDTPLLIALRHDAITVAELILTCYPHLIDIDYANRDGMTALMMAAQYCDSPDIVKLLLKNGANPLLKNNHGKTALSLCETRMESLGEDSVFDIDEMIERLEKAESACKRTLKALK